MRDVNACRRGGWCWSVGGGRKESRARSHALRPASPGKISVGIRFGRASRWPTAAVLKTAEQKCLEGSTPSPSAWGISFEIWNLRFEIWQPRVFGRAAKVPAFQTGQVGSTPTRHSELIDRGSSNGRIPDFESGDVRFESSSPNREGRKDNSGTVAAGRDTWL